MVEAGPRSWQGLVDRLLGGEDPYAGLDSGIEAEPFAAWDSESPWFAWCVERVKPELVIEVGTWLGGSALHLARLTDAPIVCVDTWLGDALLWSQPETRRMLRFRHGRPQIYETFLANVVLAGKQRQLVPVSLTSQAAAELLAQHGVTAGLVYIDGGHDRATAMADIRGYWPLVEPGGVMLVDDYQPSAPFFAGVVQAVNRFAIERNLDVDVSGNKACIHKPA